MGRDRLLQKVHVLALNWDGSRDTGYGDGGAATVANRPRNVFWNIAVDPQGLVLLGGETAFKRGHAASGSLSVVRLVARGTVDHRFGEKGWAAIHFSRTKGWYGLPGLVVGSEGSITVGAVARYRSGATRAVLARLRP